MVTERDHDLRLEDLFAEARRAAPSPSGDLMARILADAVIEAEGRTVGRVWIARTEKEIRLLDIALLPEAQRQRLGAAIVGALIEEARASGKRLRHMVFMLNTDARRFYERLGFRVFEDLGGYLHMEWAPGSEG